ncbi:Uncharacterized protein QTN25_002249 [Entamoeba marina]
MIKQTNTVALKISASRTKKAISAASLIMFVIHENAKIKFTSTKQSYYAEKVFIGEEITFDDHFYTKSDFIKIAYCFDLEMRRIISNAKERGKKEIVVTNSLIDINNQPYNIVEGSNSKIRNKNREAAFSNCLAYLLISRGYTLITPIKKMKMSSKTIQFYSWQTIISPNQVKFCISQNDELLHSVLAVLKSHVMTCVPLEIGKDQLFQNISYFDSLEKNSAFHQPMSHHHFNSNSYSKQQSTPPSAFTTVTFNYEVITNDYFM